MNLELIATFLIFCIVAGWIGLITYCAWVVVVLVIVELFGLSNGL